MTKVSSLITSIRPNELKTWINSELLKQHFSACTFGYVCCADHNHEKQT